MDSVKHIFTIPRPFQKIPCVGDQSQGVSNLGEHIDYYSWLCYCPHPLIDIITLEFGMATDGITKCIQRI